LHQWRYTVTERKNTYELDFSVSNKTQPLPPNYVPRVKTVTAAFLHKALPKIYSGFWASKTNHVCTELVFCQASAQKAIAASIFNNWLCKKESKCSPSSIFCIFHTIGILMYLLLKGKLELASCLMTKGTFKKSLQGVAPTIVT
jgi:hypothetical protein